MKVGKEGEGEGEGEGYQGSQSKGTIQVLLLVEKQKLTQCL